MSLRMWQYRNLYYNHNYYYYYYYYLLLLLFLSLSLSKDQSDICGLKDRKRPAFQQRPFSSYGQSQPGAIIGDTHDARSIDENCCSISAQKTTKN